MTNTMRACPNCGEVLHLLLAPHSRTHCREVWRCLRCKYEEIGCLREGEVHVEPEFAITITWHPDSLTVDKIKAIRGVAPELAVLPVSEAVSRLKSLQQWTISGLDRVELDRLRIFCERSGLHYEVT
jgi:hypothetical protein